MVGIYCCVQGCWEPYGGNSKKHCFPNPEKDPALFNKWLKLCGNKRLQEEHMTPEKIHKNCRVCHKHFVQNDFEANDILKRTAYPHINMPVDSENNENITPNNSVPSVSTYTSMVLSDHTYVKLSYVEVAMIDQPTSLGNLNLESHDVDITNQPTTSTRINTPPRRPSSGLLSEISTGKSRFDTKS